MQHLSYFWGRCIFNIKELARWLFLFYKADRILPVTQVLNSIMVRRKNWAIWYGVVYTHSNKLRTLDFFELNQWELFFLGEVLFSASYFQANKSRRRSVPAYLRDAFSGGILSWIYLSSLYSSVSKRNLRFLNWTFRESESVVN